MGNRYYVVKEQAVPEVLLKVVEAKKLLDTGKVHTVNEAVSIIPSSVLALYTPLLGSLVIAFANKSNVG